IGLAYRAWARSYPQRYQLIFGTPIPGYEQQQTKIIPSATRSISALVSVIEDFRVAGRLKSENFPQMPPEYEAQLSAMNTCTSVYNSLSHGVALIVWSRVHGLVSLEIGGRLPPFGVDGDGLYHYELQSIAKQFIKE
ncbi:MAG: TetR-like C-terminal domain-containing protein, partial [Chlorobium sp.]